MEVEANPAIRTYRLLPAALPDAERRVRNRQIIPQMAVVAAVFILSIALGSWKNASLTYLVAITIFGAALLTYMFFMTPRRVRRILARCWQTYTLEIGPDYLLRRQAETPDLRLSFSEIKRIERRPGEYVRVIGPHRLQVIGIPEGIDRFDDVWQTLSSLAPVNPLTSIQRSYFTIGSAAGAALFLAALWVRSPELSLILLLSFIALAGWALAITVRSPNVTRKGRRNGVMLYSWLILLCLLKVVSVVADLRKH